MTPVKRKIFPAHRQPATPASPAADQASTPSAASPSAAPPATLASVGSQAGLPAPAEPWMRPPLDLADQLHSVAIHLLRRLRVRDREAGIGPAQLSALSVLVFGGPKSLSELADAEQVRPPTMSRIVAGLERARLVRRHATEDGRRVRLEATPKGVSLMWESRKRRVETLANALNTVSEGERTRLGEAVALLRHVIRNL